MTNTNRSDSEPTKTKSNIIPLTDKLQVSFNPAFDRLSTKQVHQMLGFAEQYLAMTRIELSKRNQANKAAQLKRKRNNLRRGQ